MGLLLALWAMFESKFRFPRFVRCGSSSIEISQLCTYFCCAFHFTAFAHYIDAREAQEGGVAGWCDSAPTRANNRTLPSECARVHVLEHVRIFEFFIGDASSVPQYI